jgi:hypothetical protein
MQMMPKISWPQRVLSEASAGVWTADVSVLTLSSLRGAPLRLDGLANVFATANASFTLSDEPFKKTVARCIMNCAMQQGQNTNLSSRLISSLLSFYWLL